MLLDGWNKLYYDSFYSWLSNYLFTARRYNPVVADYIPQHGVLNNSYNVRQPLDRYSLTQSQRSVYLH